MKEKSPEQKHLEAEFFAKDLKLSYSALNLLLQSPTLYYNKYVLNQDENISGKHIDQGQVIHCLLLDRHLFDEKFIVASSNLPTENTKLVVDKVFEYHSALTKGLDTFNFKDLGDYTDEIVHVLKEINLHQSLKTDQQRIEKIVNTQSIEYFDYLKVAESKTIIDNVSFERCLLAMESVQNHKKASALLGLEANPENVIYNEHPLELEKHNAYPFGFKGILDNINLDRGNKIIYINDLKTTGKSLIHFQDSVEKYNYGFQAAMYFKLVKAKFKELIDNGWKIVFNFIVVDVFNQTYVFEVSDVTMSIWGAGLAEKLIEATYHYKENDYTLPYRFATGKVIL